MSTEKNINKPKIIIVGGPTSSGKSALAIKIAQRFKGEIIGADSMQIYRGMDIGTGKAMPNERGGIKHWLIDIVDPSQMYSAGRYSRDAGQAIDAVLRDGKLPIIAGGTGLYINSLISGYSFSETDRNIEFREQLLKEASAHGVQVLYERLRKIDDLSAQKIMPTDLKRIVRALEICEFSGNTKSENVDKAEGRFDYLMLLIKTDRERLYQSINTRVDRMLEDGLVDEVRSLDLKPESTAAKAIGYKETLEYLSNLNDTNAKLCSNLTDSRFDTKDLSESANLDSLNNTKKISTLLELSEAIKINTRHYAKRQITYFKNVFKSSHYVGVHEFDTIDKLITDFLSLSR